MFEAGEPYHTKIKICGLRCREDIAYVNEAQPDFCGFIINVPQSIRNTTPDQVRALQELLRPEVAPVGVFRDAPVELVAELLRDGTIAAAQLHGCEDESYIRRLREQAGNTAVIIKAFSEKLLRQMMEESDSGKTFSSLPETQKPDGAANARQPSDSGTASSRLPAAANASSADYVLLDHGGGGTGQRFDWALAGQVRRPYFLAGGIGPENMIEAVRRLQPWALDLSSSVETDGRKDRAKIVAAVQTLREYEAR